MKGVQKVNKVDACLKYYLSKRNYIEGDLGTENNTLVDTFSDPTAKSLTCTMKELAMRCSVDSRTSASNLVAVNGLSFNPEVILEQYNKLESFISASNNVGIRMDLIDLLTPITLHVYTDLLSNGYSDKATKFLSDKKKLIKEDKTLTNIFTNLFHLRGGSTGIGGGGVSSQNDKNLNKIFVELKTKRYQLSMPNLAYHRLLAYLKDQDSLYIHQLINNHIDISVTTVDDETVTSFSDTLLADDDDVIINNNNNNNNGFGFGNDIKTSITSSMATTLFSGMATTITSSSSTSGLSSSPTSTTSTSTMSSVTVSEAQRKVDDKKSKLDLLKKLSGDIDKLTPYVPRVCHMHMKNYSHNLSCAVMSQDETFLACGYENSQIRIVKIDCDNNNNTDNYGNLDDIEGITDTASSNIGATCICSDSLSSKLPSRNDTTTLFGHYGAIYGLDYFRGGRGGGLDNMEYSKWLLSCSADKTIRLWDTETKTNVVIYRGHAYSVLDISTSPISGLFASCSYDQTAKLWSTDRIYPLRNFIGHTQAVNCLAFHPNGNYIATGSVDATARFWNVQDGRCVRLLVGHKGPLQVVRFSPDGKLIATAGDDHRVKLWDLGSGSLVKDCQGHCDVIYSLEFNRDGSLLFSGGVDGCLKVWDMNSFGANKLTTTTTATVTATTPIEGSSSSSSSSSSSLISQFQLPGRSCVIHMKYMRRNFLRVFTKQLE